MRVRRPTRSHLTALAITGVGALVACAALTPLSSVASASPTATQSQARPWVSGDHTIPYFDKTDAIHEVVEVETGMDSDRDGKVDTIRVELDRPDAKGKKVPLIVHASPYWFQDPRSAWETGFFLPHGYAVAT